MSADRCPVCLLPVDPVERQELVRALLSRRERAGATTAQECRGCGCYSSPLLRERAAAASEATAAGEG